MVVVLVSGFIRVGLGDLRKCVISFLAPTGAQEMLIFFRSFVCLSIRSSLVCQELLIVIILAQTHFKSTQRAFKGAVREHSEHLEGTQSTQRELRASERPRAVREHPESTQRAPREHSESTQNQYLRMNEIFRS